MMHDQANIKLNTVALHYKLFQVFAANVFEKYVKSSAY